jgi:hypothetical protein
VGHTAEVFIKEDVLDVSDVIAFAVEQAGTERL